MRGGRAPRRQTARGRRAGGAGRRRGAAALRCRGLGGTAAGEVGGRGINGTEGAGEGGWRCTRTRARAGATPTLCGHAAEGGGALRAARCEPNGEAARKAAEAAG